MGKRTSNRITVAQKRETALALAIAEASFSQIAAQIGCSKSRAHQLVQEALKEIEDGTKEAAELFRRKMLARNNKMIQGLISRAQKGDTKAIDTLLRIQDQSAKVIGAYAPAKTALTDPTGEKEWEGRPDPRTMSSEERLARISELTEQLRGDGGKK
jgi:hypothetical protein